VGADRAGADRGFGEYEVLTIVLKSQVLGRRLHCVIEAIHEGKVAGLQHYVGSTLVSKDSNDLPVVLVDNGLRIARQLAGEFYDRPLISSQHGIIRPHLKEFGWVYSRSPQSKKHVKCAIPATVCRRNRERSVPHKNPGQCDRRPKNLSVVPPRLWNVGTPQHDALTMWKSYSHGGLATRFSILEGGLVLAQKCQLAVIKDRYAGRRLRIDVFRRLGSESHAPAFDRQIKCIGYPGEVVEEAHGKCEFNHLRVVKKSSDLAIFRILDSSRICGHSCRIEKRHSFFLGESGFAAGAEPGQR
jgi:hypothetical protein